MAATKKKTTRTSNRRRIPDEIWEELRKLYETGDYSQDQLAAYMKARGYPVSQARISQRVTADNWIKGAELERLRKEEYDKIADRFGESTRKMLEQHAQTGKMIQLHVVQHFHAANEKRKTDPGHVIPAVILRMLSATAKEAQEIEARAVGWDYRTGRLFAYSGEQEAVEQQAPKMIFEEYSASEIDQLQTNAEREFRGETGDD